MARRPPTRRQLGLEPRYTARKFRPYALAIGEATLSWNDLHEELGMLFVTVSGGGDANKFLKKWHAIRNDGEKRDSLIAAAKMSLNSSLERDQLVLSEVKWILDCVKKLADDRNTITHAPLTSTPTTSTVFPHAWPGNPRALKLVGLDVLTEYRRLRDTAVLLRDYSGRLGHALTRERPSWPDRPKLPQKASKLPLCVE